jgi:hypothetical protein
MEGVLLVAPSYRVVLFFIFAHKLRERVEAEA